MITNSIINDNMMVIITTYIHIYIYIHMYVCMYVYMYVYIYIYTYDLHPTYKGLHPTFAASLSHRIVFFVRVRVYTLTEHIIA